KSLEGLDRALDMDPDNPYRYASRAFLKDRIGDLHGAIADYERAIEMDPEDGISINNKGLVEEKLGYQDRAKASFQKADELVGYKPGANLSADATNADIPASTALERESAAPTKVTLRSDFSTLGGVLTDQNVR